MILLLGFLNNKTLIIFICISGASISSFFALSIWLNDNNNRVSTALTLFFATIGYWAKTKYELENKSRSILELEQLIEVNRKQLHEYFSKALDRLEIEAEAANTVQDKDFDTIKEAVAKLSASLVSHVESVGHIETEKRLSDITANTKVLQLQILQVSKEYENRRLLDSIAAENREIKGFITKQGFVDRQTAKLVDQITDEG